MRKQKIAQDLLETKKEGILKEAEAKKSQILNEDAVNPENVQRIAKKL